MATVVLCCAIALSYYILKRNLIEQSRLLAFSNTTTQLISTIKDSSSYLSDLKLAKERMTSGSMLEGKITVLLDDSLLSIQELKQQTNDQLKSLKGYEYHKFFNQMFNSQPADIWLKLDQYVARLKEISATTKISDTEQQQLWLPVEATAAKKGNLGKISESASIRLQEIISERSSSLQATHSKLVLLSLFLVVLETLLIFLPLRHHLNKAYSKLLKAHQSLDYQANNDADTGLLNAVGIAKSIEEQENTVDYDSLIILSITNLENIAQTIGPSALSDFFKQFVKKIELAFPGEKTIYRAGENRFGILYLQSAFQSSPSETAQLHKSLVSKQFINNSVVYPEVKMGRVSGGVSSANFSCSTLHAMIATHAYNSIDMSIPAYDPEMQKAIAEENNKIDEIKAGLAKGEFVPFYQIKVNAQTGMACGMEALCRWVKPDGTIIPPFQFIPTAEKSGLIAEMTWSILEKMAVDYNEWRKAGLEPGRIAFNAAEMMLRETEFATHFAAILEKTGSEQSPFDLEITENVALTSKNAVIAKNLQYSRDVGMLLALDDFGTGFASLSSIVELAVDTIKVDQSFVRIMSTNDDAKNIVISIISLCKQLNKKCVVEGVEETAEWEFCRDLGCDEIQGFLFYKPAPFADVFNSLFEEQQQRKAS